MKELEDREPIIGAIRRALGTPQAQILQLSKELFLARVDLRARNLVLFLHARIYHVNERLALC